MWAVVPARLESRRVPGKVLADLGGRSLVEHVWRATQRAGCFERVVVATDSDRVAVVATGFGADVLRTGPAVSGTHRASQVAPADCSVVCVQADQPFVDPEHLRALAALLPTSEADVATLCAPLIGDPRDPARVKVRVEGGWALDFSRAPMSPRGPHRVHLGLYAFAPGALARCAAMPPSPRCQRERLEQLTWLDGGESIAIAEMTGAEPAIDTPGQLEAARAHMK